MKTLPENQLDPRVKNVWRLNDAIWVCLICAATLGCLQFLRFAPDLVGLANILTIIGLVAWVIALVVWLVVLPPIRYMRWRYEVTDDYLDIARGIFWRKRFTIPFIRVQNTDTRQGPILRAFGLSTVSVSTAAGDHVIPGLDMQVADQLRDKAAELARLAREDV